MAFLQEIDGPRRYELGVLTTLGRDPSSAIQLDDSAASLHHAEILRCGDGSYVLVDRGSERGTFQGERRISQATLADGDTLRVGRSRFRFEAGGARAPAPASEQRTASYPPAAQVDDLAKLRADYDKLRAAFVLTESLFEAHDLDSVLASVIDALFQLLAADRCGVLLLNPSTLQPQARKSRSRQGGGEIVFSTSLVSKVIETRKGLLLSDLGLLSADAGSTSLTAQAVRSVMCVPMSYRGALVGIIHVDSQSVAGAFTKADLELLGSIAFQAAVAIRSTDLLQRVHGALTDERKRLARLIRDMPDGVVMLDSRRRIAVLNSRGEQLLPLLTEARNGQVIERLGQHAVDDLLALGGPVDIEAAGPPRRILTVVGSESPTSHGNEVVLLLREVTEQREQEVRSAQDSRLALIGQLAGGVAHDFNNLLSVILNYAAFVKDELKDLPAADDVREIERAAKRAAALTGQLLAFGRRERLEPKVVLLEQVIGDIEKLVRRSLGERIEVLTRFDPAPFRVRIDPRKFDQVLLNLAVNARDAMPAGGKLVLETGKIELSENAARFERVPPGRYAWLTVQDTGTGMPPEVAARVFEPFFTTKERGKGTGLGLATVYGLIQQANGAISVRSKPGQGTTFFILLPATDDPFEGEASAPSTATSGTETILVAEDEQAVLDLTRRILVKAGYSVLAARNGEGALAQVEQEGSPVHLLLTDLVMPGMGGKQLARRMVERDPRTRVLFMSGYADEGDGLVHGAHPLLPKPFTREELLERVRAVLDASGPGDA